MNIECVKEKLKWSVATAEKVTGKNLSLPALGYVLLETKERSLVVRATNLDVGISITIPAKINKEGTVMVSGGIMANFLGNLGGSEKVVLEAVNTTLTVATPTSTSVLKTYPTDDFPTIPRITDENKFHISATALVEGLRSVLYSASLSDIKPEIASVYLYQEGKELIFVATDSFRLAEKKIRLDQVPPEALKLIIPIKNVSELVRVFEGSEEIVTVAYSAHQVAFSSETIYFTSRLIEGVFPDYRQIMPTGHQTLLTLAKQDLVSTLRLSSVFSDKLNQILLRVMPKDNLVELTSRNSDVGETTSQIKASTEGEDLEISFNVRYLLDCLASVPSSNLTLSSAGKQRPLVVQGAGDKSFTYLIMPLNR